MIYTSYFGNMRKLSGITPVSIARMTPRQIKIAEYKALAPRYEMLRMNMSDYLVEYQKILHSLNPEKVLQELQAIGNGKPIALLCYEKPHEFCHRHLVSEWLSYSLSATVEEYGSNVMSLF